MAAALLGEPQILLFYEPVNGLDPESIHWIRTLLRSFAGQGGTVLVSSHLMSEMALTVAGLDAARIGDLAATHRITLHELSTGSASLEQAFITRTEASVDYHVTAQGART